MCFSINVVVVVVVVVLVFIAKNFGQILTFSEGADSPYGQPDNERRVYIGTRSNV